jgi:hypothetical protein
MVKQQDFSTAKTHDCKGFSNGNARASKISASTAYDTCREQLSPFGGLLALIKFLDLLKFDQMFHELYRPPRRRSAMGDWGMVAGVLMLLFIGFNRLWHFTYVRLDSLLCGFFHLNRLPVASTYWRYVDSLGINQANSLVNLMTALRQRFWQLCGLRFHKLHINGWPPSFGISGRNQRNTHSNPFFSIKIYSVPQNHSSTGRKLTVLEIAK